MSWVDRAAAAGFAARADDYERGRPGYPAAAVAALRDELGLEEGATVVDLAAGTGKLSRELTELGARVVAVEPIAEMRALIGPPVEAVEGTAEAIPVADAGADAVTVAQAFHWFDGDRALAEIHRVLRPGGRLALVWNRRHDDDAITAAVEEIIGPYRGDTPHHRSGRWRDAFDRTELFGRLEERRFDNAQELDGEGLALRFGSVSFVATLPGDERERVLDRLRALAPDGPAAIAYVTEVFLCRRAGGTLPSMDDEQAHPKPSEQRGGTTPDEQEAREKGEWAGTADEGVVPAELGGSDAPREMLPDDPELDSSVLGETTGSDEPATDEGVDLSAGDQADATTDGGTDLPDEGEPDLKDIGSAPRQSDAESAE